MNPNKLLKKEPKQSNAYMSCVASSLDKSCKVLKIIFLLSISCYNKIDIEEKKDNILQTFKLLGY